MSEQPDELDYRPLPSRRGNPTIKPIDVERAVRWRWLNGWLVLVITTALVISGTGGLIWLNTRPPAETAPQQMPLFASTILSEISDPNVRDQLLALDASTIQAQSVINQNPRDPNGWIMLGHAHYDFIQMIYEHAPNGQAYVQNLSRWIQASDAYSQALALDNFQPLIRSDRAVALARYGIGFGNPFYSEQALAEAETALAQDDQTLLVLLNVGRVYALLPEPRMADAERLWRKVIELGPSSLQAELAQSLLDGAKP